ncbi:acid sphingomyelinase-like phosphodiesterase 3b [Grus japonensis]|uniref:Acid sphingomyelinase-like phosphodiesterase 3b n=1 Tax=Grus japonensis TaxID=30415 RepID=A0ABC9XBN9_GRUJA
MPAGFKMDPPLAKAESLSTSGSASGIMYVRKEKAVQQLQPERGVRICERNNSADTKGSNEVGAGGAPGARPENPCSLWRVRQAVPLQPMEDDGEQRFLLQPMEDPTPEQVDAQRKL